jgi:hypothetical protein
MNRPSRTVIALFVVLLAFIVIEVVVWWPEAPKPKRQAEETPARDEPQREPAAKLPLPIPTAPTQTPSASRGRTVPQIRIDETAEEIRQLQTCRGKHCGDPCVLRCDPSDGQCTPQGIRPGACASNGECNYMMPAICPAD